MKKRRPGCTGMCWRGDPGGKTRPVSSNNNGPRDGAVLRGEAVVVKGKKWLRAKQLRYRGGVWQDAPANMWLPFEYDNHYYLSEHP